MRAIVLPSLVHSPGSRGPAEGQFARLPAHAVRAPLDGAGSDLQPTAGAQISRLDAPFAAQLLGQIPAGGMSLLATVRLRNSLAAYDETLSRQSQPKRRLLGRGILA